VQAEELSEPGQIDIEGDSWRFLSEGAAVSPEELTAAHREGLQRSSRPRRELLLARPSFTAGAMVGKAGPVVVPLRSAVRPTSARGKPMKPSRLPTPVLQSHLTALLAPAISCAFAGCALDAFDRPRWVATASAQPPQQGIGWAQCTRSPQGAQVRQGCDGSARPLASTWAQMKRWPKTPPPPSRRITTSRAAARGLSASMRVRMLGCFALARPR